ncbi:Uncharacterised protein [Yersinia frederiksenii]|uniref:Uncharacterized protein n=3 Tax=Yersinia frederiksenii TaxID=29484 RepID=A0A380PYH3_YERFR|nr:hypothetical protein [Yersinia frederiksenii]ATM97328.1 hypothetical protein CRN75_19435 [Yersinia frederiksenii]EEQ13504.1 hypothetical protein yfred0001_19050 [Yersinia frederiksenii ATCC 33641]KGA46166.1 hypothetical protein DJ58_1173 [Yersinia frederiksenii ATCC 33641]CFR02168.1 Uncharacterised protein [Yersinia frederiksenii]SUP78272.1 Uncharacterised protein [Yersinia frederiksenii]
MRVGSVDYEFICGSDVVRDGMYMEVRITETNPSRQIAEVFYSDVLATFTLSCFEQDIPFEVTALP